MHKLESVLIVHLDCLSEELHLFLRDFWVLPALPELASVFAFEN